MAQRAIKDTYATESIYGCEVRRFVKAGSVIPPHYIVEPGEFEEVAVENPILGGLTTPPPLRIPPDHSQSKPADYAGMSFSQLKEAAQERGIAVTSDAKKADLLEALER